MTIYLGGLGSVTNSMKILYGITKSNWGGAQRYVYDMALAAREAGHDVAVLCGGEGKLVENLRSQNIRTIVIPGFGRDIDMLGDAKRLWFITKTLRAERPDILHINSSKMGGAGIFAGRLLGVPKIIFTAHGWAFNEPRHWAQKMLIEELSWLTVLGSHQTICVSEAVKRDIEAKPFIKEKLVVITHGIEAFRLEDRDKARQILCPGIEDKTLLIGTLAELHKVKGLDIAIRAFAKASIDKDAMFAIVGEGEERYRLVSLIKKLGIQEKVHFLGFMENGRELLSGLDIFVHPSRSEALGFSILEAGLASLPVIATRVGGIPEIIDDYKNGLLVEREDARTLANALLRLADDPKLRKSLGANLHKHVQTAFSKDRMIRETLATYR